MQDVTELLHRIADGDTEAAAELARDLSRAPVVQTISLIKCQAIAGASAAVRLESKTHRTRADARSVPGRAVMMALSTRSLPLFGVLFITVLGASCAQPGDGLLTSPSSLSVGSSATALGPGADYNASGLWRFVTTDIHGNVEETFETNVSQDANGNLSFLDEDGFLITLERLGTGAIITYRQFQVAPPEGGGECDIRLQATVRLDTRTNTLSGNVFLRELGCSHQHLGPLFVTGTKLS